MSRARHKKHHGKAAGGKVSWAGGNQNVIKEAHERKRGGRVHHEGEGEEPKHHAGKHHRKHGGKVHHRARGGAVGSDKRPLSSAHNYKKAHGEEDTNAGGAHAGEHAANP